MKHETMVCAVCLSIFLWFNLLNCWCCEAFTICVIFISLYTSMWQTIKLWLTIHSSTNQCKLLSIFMNWILTYTFYILSFRAIIAHLSTKSHLIHFVKIFTSLSLDQIASLYVNLEFRRRVPRLSFRMDAGFEVTQMLNPLSSDKTAKFYTWQFIFWNFHL